MLAVALLAVAPVMLFGRATPAAEPPEPPTVELAMPDALAGGIEPGDVPDTVADAADGPVLGAVRVDEIPPGATCHHEGVFADEPVLEFAVVGPFGLSASFVGAGGAEFGPPPPGPRAAPVPQPDRPAGPAPPALPPAPAAANPPAERLRAICGATWDGAGWTGGGQSISPVDHPEAGGGIGMSCCDEQGLGTASVSLPVPDGVAWVLQDQGGWWVAYPVEGAPVVALNWKFVDPGARRGMFEGHGPVTSTLVLLLDAGGDVIEERLLSA